MEETTNKYKPMLYGLSGFLIYFLGGLFGNIYMYILFAAIGITLIVIGTMIEIRGTKLKRNVYGIIIGRIGLLLILSWLPVALNFFDFPFSNWVHSSGALLILIGLTLKKEESRDIFGMIENK